MIGASAVSMYMPMGTDSVLLQDLLTNLCQFDILQSDPGRGPNAIRSLETSRVHHTARQRGCGVAARGARAAAGDAGLRHSTRLFARIRPNLHGAAAGLHAGAWLC